MDQGRIKTEGQGVLEDRLIAGHLEDYCKLTWRYDLRCACCFRTAHGGFEQKCGVFPNTYVQDSGDSPILQAEQRFTAGLMHAQGGCSRDGEKDIGDSAAVV
jgi:hypothetical protein